MTTDQIRRLHKARPFAPFDINIADGRTLTIEHPELLAVPPGERCIGVGMPDGTIEIVDLPLVTSLKPRSNGDSRRKKRG
jgi:hypothetical protein